MSVGACGFRRSTVGNVAVMNLKFETLYFMSVSDLVRAP